MFYFPIGVMLFSLILAAPALAQSGPVESRKKGGGPVLCDGKIAGRWRVTFTDPSGVCTLEIKADGRIRSRSNVAYECLGVGLHEGTGDVTGGRFTRQKPRRNKHGSGRQCWFSGHIRIDDGAGRFRWRVTEAFIERGGAAFHGWSWHSEPWRVIHGTWY